MKIKKKTFGYIRTLTDVVIRAVFFFIFPAVWATAFGGVRYLVTTIEKGQPINWGQPFLVALYVVLGFTIVFGRFFCGFACSFGTYGDALYAISSFIRKKLKKKPLKVTGKIHNRLKYVKFAVLLIVIFFCFIGMEKNVINSSPWTVFSRFQAYALPQKTLMLGIVFFVIISIGDLLESRFFCRFLCPLGAIFSLMPVLHFSAVKRDRPNCVKGCKACEVKCPADLEIVSAAEGSAPQMGECFSCGKCTDVCPKSHCGSMVVTRGVKGIVWNIVRAAIFFGICMFFF